MRKTVVSEREKIYIPFIFAFLGLSTTIGSNALINVSFVLNEIYQNKIAVPVLGYLSAFMIISSFLQLSSTFISFNAILWSNFFNVINVLLLLLLTSVFVAHPYFVYAVVSLVGFFLGFSYSASTKYSLLFPLEVSRYLTGGISFSAVLHLVINIVVTILCVDEKNKSTYKRGVQVSFGIAALIITVMLLGIITLRRKSAFFIQAQEEIENMYIKNSAFTNNDANDINDNSNKLGLSSLHKEPPEKQTEVEQESKHKQRQKVHEKNSADVAAIETISNNKNSSPKINVKEKTSMNKLSTSDSKENKSYNTSNSISKPLYMREKWKVFRMSFNYRNLFLGAQLVKYYYPCLIGVSYTIFISFVTYPHIIPNSFNKGIYTRYMFMLMYQLSDLFSNFCIISSSKLRQILTKKVVVVASLLRTLILIVSFIISRLDETHVLYSEYVIGPLIILLGLTSGSLVNTSYAIIPSCFKDDSSKEKNITAASSFTALCFLVSFSLSPWCYYLLMKL